MARINVIFANAMGDGMGGFIDGQCTWYLWDTKKKYGEKKIEE